MSCNTTECTTTAKVGDCVNITQTFSNTIFVSYCYYY